MPTGTIRTDTALYAEFPDSAGGGIVAADVRDVIASKPNVMDLYDDYANVSGLSAPAILRGTVYGHKTAGLIIGAGQTTGVRTANATALQSAITYAAGNNKYFELEPNTYEIYSSTGLVIPTTQTNTFQWHGDLLNTIIVQFYATSPGAPVLTVGDSTGANYSYDWVIDGANLQYGVGQAANTSAAALLLCALNGCIVRNVQCGDSGGVYPFYYGMQLGVGTAPTAVPFSNIFENISINGGLNSMTHLYAPWVGTGNIFDNIYLKNSSQPVATNGCYINICPNQGFSEQDFRQINCEWGSTNCVIQQSFANGINWNHLHVEGITFTGVNPTLISNNGGMGKISQLTIVDCIFLAANMTAPAAIFSDYTPGDSINRVESLVWILNHTTEIDSAITLFNPSGLSDIPPVFSVADFMIGDAGSNSVATHISIDPHMPASSTAFNLPHKFRTYEYNKKGSLVKAANLTITSTYTHYGQLEDAVIQVPNAITSFTLTLADTMGASGTQVPRTGSTVNVRRMSGTASGTLTVKDGGGTTITTNTTSNADLYYQFNGTAWVAFTAVT